MSDPEKCFHEPRARKPQLPRPYEYMGDDDDLDDIPELDLGEPASDISEDFSATGKFEPSLSKTLNADTFFPSFRPHRKRQYDLVT